MISLEQEELVCKLYKAKKHTIKQIIKETGVRSEQTIYRILDENNIPRRPKRETVMKATISFDKKTAGIIKKENPPNLSEWVCNKIQRAGK